MLSAAKDAIYAWWLAPQKYYYLTMKQIQKDIIIRIWPTPMIVWDVLLVHQFVRTPALLSTKLNSKFLEYLSIKKNIVSTL